MSDNLTVKILEVGGLEIAARYVGLPVGKVRLKADVMRSFGNLDRESVSRLNRLISQGDEHAKIMRQVVVHMEITAPRYWWQQFATYEIGREMYSGSTMHTLLRDEPSLENFTEQVSPHTYRAFKEIVASYGYVTITDAKANLPEGFLQTRLIMVSYTTLRRIWLQRRKHKLGEWHEFTEAMQELPYCHDLIFVEPRNPWRELWVEWFDFSGDPWQDGEWGGEKACFFCTSAAEHEPGCIYLKAKELLDKESAQ